MENTRQCPNCGQPLPAGAPQGLCPACLLQAGFPTGAPSAATGPGLAKAEKFVPPAPAALAAHFPQLEILGLIGQGGMGAVYKARQPSLDRLVALKILAPRGIDDPGFAERFTREARALAKLNHPNIVAVHDFGQSGGFHYFIMEYVDGPNLRQIERAGKLTAKEALQIIPQICEALQFAHDEGIVHRDIKPENILLDKKGRVKIADFGLAKLLGHGGVTERVTEAGHVMGTPHYMAPEQIEHPLEVDHRADIYSLGVVFYEMLTGELPLGKFAVPSRKAPMDARLDEVVLRTLEKEPAQRYQQASQLKTDVETIATGSSQQSPPPTMATKTVFTGPLRYGWVFAVLFALAFLATDSITRLRGIKQTSDLYFEGTPAPAKDPASLTGYYGNSHVQIMPALGTDGYHWMMQAEEMVGGQNGLRVRHVDYDGPPGGRDVHWSGSLHWLIAALAWVDHVINGVPMNEALQREMPWANTFVLLLLILILPAAVWRRLGPVAAALLALGFVLAYPYYEFSFIGYFDHHGLAASCDLLMILFLVGSGAGCLRDETVRVERLTPVERALWQWLPDRRQAKRWVIASAIAGGVGLWVSAASVVPCLLGIGAGALLGEELLARDTQEKSCWRLDPTLWRVWGTAGACTSLVFYGLEYMPAHFTWRLEVNHPLYALAWFGAGDILCRLGLLMRGRSADRTQVAMGQHVGWLLLDVMMLAAIPAAILIFQEKVFSLLPGTFLMFLHKDYILEFRTFLGQMKFLSWLQIVGGISAIPLTVVPALRLLFDSDLQRPWKAILLVALLPGLVVLGLALWMIRWLGICCAVWSAGLAAVALITSAPGSAFRWTILRKITAAAFLFIVLVPFPVFTCLQWYYSPHFATPVSNLDQVQAVTRDVSQRLRLRLGVEQGNIVSGPTTTTWMMYFGGFRGVGTLYWENVQGLWITDMINSTPSMEQAHEFIKENHVTHLVIYSWDAFVMEYARLAQEVNQNNPLKWPGNGPGTTDDAFLLRLLRQRAIPPWLRPIPYHIPDLPSLKDSFVLMLEVVPDQTIEEAGVRNAQWIISVGTPNSLDNAEKTLKGALDKKPDYLPALIALALLEKQRGEDNVFHDTLQAIGPHLDQADTLALDDRVDLCIALAANNQTQEAAREVAACLVMADEKSLRRVQPERLALFLELASHIKNPTPAEQKAVQLGNGLLHPESSAGNGKS